MKNISFIPEDTILVTADVVILFYWYSNLILVYHTQQA